MGNRGRFFWIMVQERYRVFFTDNEDNEEKELGGTRNNLTNVENQRKKESKLHGRLNRFVDFITKDFHNTTTKTKQIKHDTATSCNVRADFPCKGK